MTCKEKFIAEHPDLDKEHIQYVIGNQCPDDYDYLGAPRNSAGNLICDGVLCKSCWDREIPETNTSNNVQTNSHDVRNEKEKNMTTTKKTKAQLMEELETSENTVKDLKQQLKDLEKYKVYEDAGDEMKAIHTAFMNAGFSDEQAFELIRLSMIFQMSSTTNANIRCDFNYDALRKAARR